MKKLYCSLAVGVLSALALAAAELGDPAAPLDMTDWVKGSPVSLAEGKGTNIYVVEFWATWCGPCRTSIPHLTELQKKFKDKGVVFIGVSDEKTDVVKKFVEKMGEQMDYTVAVDGGKTSEGYMQAYGIDGIPHAFIVDKQGKIVWHGHPMDRLEETLTKMIAGKYDLATARKQAEAESKLQEYVGLTLSGNDPDKLAKLEAELVALEKEVGNIVNGEKFEPEDIKKRIAFGQKFMKYQQLLAGEADETEIAALEKELEAGAPQGFDLQEVKAGLKKSLAQRKEAMKVQTLFQNYAEAVGEQANEEKATDLGKQLAELQIDNAELLGGIAWTILTDERIKKRDTKLALNFAKRAVDASAGKEANILDTYARALFDTGSTAEAITQQKKAIELAEDEDLKTELKETLEKYEAKSKEAK
jgi:thiol-disulfide isomerase/thioredoxin